MSSKTNAYRRYALAGATFSVAVSIGFLMQSSEASTALVATNVARAPDNMAPVQVRVTPQGKPHTVEASTGLPLLPQDHAAETELPVRTVMVATTRDVPVGQLPFEEQAPALGCDIEFTAEAVAGAMVDLVFRSPCHAGERVTFSHETLSFSYVTGVDGSLEVTVPAMSSNALFVANFTNGNGAVTTVSVDSLDFYDRVALQLTGSSGLELHAREFGAEYGAEGHVWHGAPRELSAMIGGAGGFLSTLGDPSLPEAQLAEVYTFPTGIAHQVGQVEMSIETEVTSENCGRQVSMHSIQVVGGKPLSSHKMNLEVPDCDAVGEFLVLKNILDTLKIAQN